MAIHDTALAAEINYHLRLLELLIDRVAPTPLRHSLSEQVVNMRKELNNFNQDAWEPSIDEEV